MQKEKTTLKEIVLTILAVTLILSLTTITIVVAYPYSPDDTEVANALNYLRSIQQPNGCIKDFGTSNWAVMAIAAAGENPHDWKKNEGSSIVEYLKANTDLLGDLSDLNSASGIARFILSMVAADENPRDINGTDYVDVLEGLFNNGQMGNATWLFDDFWSVIALVSAGSVNTTILETTVQFIKDNQNSVDGGWGWAVGASSDVDDTAAAIMALIAAGEPRSSSIIISALNFLKENQQEDGGFPSWGVTNSASDSWGISAIVAANQDPTSPEWTKGGNTPVSHLLTLQNPDGSFNWTTIDPPWVNKELNTCYAIIALLGRSYPTILFISTDVNRDGTVNMKDIYRGILAYGSEPYSEKWDRYCDTNNDSKINMKDIFAMILDFGTTY